MQICNPRRTEDLELETIFKMIMAENCPKLKKRFNWEFLSTPNNIKTEKCIFISIMIKLLKTKDKEKNL